MIRTATVTDVTAAGVWVVSSWLTVPTGPLDVFGPTPSAGDPVLVVRTDDGEMVVCGRVPDGLRDMRGDVTGPASATDGAVPLFDGTTGTVLKSSGLSVVGGRLSGLANGTASTDAVNLGQLTSVSASGTGSPEGAVTAPPGSEWRQTNDANLGHLRWFKATGTGSTGWLPDFEGRWVSYTPAFTASTTDPTNWTMTGKYTRTGKTITAKMRAQAATGVTSGSGNYRVSLPVTGIGDPITPHFAAAFHSGQRVLMAALLLTSTYLEFRYPDGSPTGTNTALSSTSPWSSWASGDTIGVQVTYEAS
jgi:hypothetical protein